MRPVSEVQGVRATDSADSLHINRKTLISKPKAWLSRHTPELSSGGASAGKSWLVWCSNSFVVLVDRVAGKGIVVLVLV